MSRIGRQPVTIPDGVEVKLDGRNVAVKGPKGSLSLELPSTITAQVEGRELRVATADPDAKRERALWGLTRVLLANMVEGVTRGFEKVLEIQGVGYRAEVKGKGLVLNIGFSHPVEFPIPEGIAVTVEKSTVKVSGVDKQLVGETAAKIRRLRPPEPYKGTGIRYRDEVVRRKAGKAVKAAGATK